MTGSFNPGHRASDFRGAVVDYMPEPPESIAIVRRMPPTIPTSGLSLLSSQSLRDPMEYLSCLVQLSSRAYRRIVSDMSLSVDIGM